MVDSPSYPAGSTRPKDDRLVSETETDWPERIDPLDTRPGVVAHHLKKYEFARSRIGGFVVDVACGVGYGTDYLGSATDLVVGIEIADDAIRIAGQRYRHDNVYFVQGSAENLPFRDTSVDAVVCFEGIEHFTDPERHLEEVTRVLRPNGTYLLSTPNPLTNPHDHENPFHLHQFELNGFELMLRERFAHVEMLGQSRTQSDAHRAAQRADVLGLRRWRALRPLTRWVSRYVLKTVPTEEATLDDFVIEPFSERSLEYVVACRTPGL
jgi:SAM-dependent methyltransferase